MKTRLRTKALLVAVVLLAGVAVDQAFKVAAVRWLKDRPPASVAGGFVQFRYVENRGAMLGIGAGLTPSQRRWVFTIAECALLAALVGYALRSAGSGSLELWAVALLASGGAGNVVDRVALGFVRDFVLIGIDGLPTAAFNVADVLAAAGGILLLVSVLASRDQSR